MLKNQILIAWRNLLRDKGYAVINLVGLSIGLASCLLMLLYVLDELSYDRWHENPQELYRLHFHYVTPEEEGGWACVPPGIGPQMTEHFSDITLSARLMRTWRTTTMRYEDRIFLEDNMVYADSSLFDIFGYTFVYGDKFTALNRPYTMTITRSVAQKYFGDENPIGKSLSSGSGREYEITAVIDDMPSQSHLHADLLVSMVTLREIIGEDFLENDTRSNFYSYLRVADGTDIADLEARITAYLEELYPDEEGQDENEGTYEFLLQPVVDIHLHSKLEKEFEPNGRIEYVYVFSAAALLVLLIATLNYINLSTARSLRRAREIGVRKVLGAGKGRLIGQFLVESIQYTLVSMLLAVPIILLALPWFNRLAGKQFSAGILVEPHILLSLLGMTLLVGLLAGVYPALILSSFSPSEVFGSISRGKKKSRFRQTMVVVQFTLSIALIAATLVVHNQLSFMRNKPLGFEKEQLLLIPLQPSVTRQLETFKSELCALDGVLDAGASMAVPGIRFEYWAFSFESHGEQVNTVAARSITVDHDFLRTLGVTFLQGRDFSRDYPTDATSAIIVNQAAVDQYGWENPIGTPIHRTVAHDQRDNTIIGVIDNFHYASLHNEIEPLFIQIVEGRYRLVAARLSGENIPATIEQIEKIWEKFAPESPFDYSFLDQDFNTLYKGEERLAQVFGTFSGIGILLAYLGIVGLVAYSSQQRFKEFAIRKVLGAEVSNLVYLISRETVILVLIANVVAIAPVVYAMQHWLDGFAYRTGLGAGPFLLSGSLALLIALITVSLMALRTAHLNPVGALRNE